MNFAQKVSLIVSRWGVTCLLVWILFFCEFSIVIHTYIYVVRTDGIKKAPVVLDSRCNSVYIQSMCDRTMYVSSFPSMLSLCHIYLFKL